MKPADPVFDLCDCPLNPVMWWLLPHKGWVVAYGMNGQRDIPADAKEYRKQGALAFQVSCPTCQRVYVRGVG